MTGRSRAGSLVCWIDLCCENRRSGDGPVAHRRHAAGGLPVSRAVAGITLDNLDELPKRCRRCVFWELAPHLAQQAAEYGSTELEKEAWVSSVLLEWGSCGKIAHVQDVPA